MHIYILLEAKDKDVAANLEAQLGGRGHKVQIHSKDIFSIADPLAFLLESVRQQYHLVIVLISRKSFHTEWIVRELRAQRDMSTTEKQRITFVTLFLDNKAAPDWLDNNDKPYFFCNTNDTTTEIIQNITQISE